MQSRFDEKELQQINETENPKTHKLAPILNKNGLQNMTKNMVLFNNYSENDRKSNEPKRMFIDNIINDSNGHSENSKNTELDKKVGEKKDLNKVREYANFEYPIKNNVIIHNNLQNTKRIEENDILKISKVPHPSEVKLDQNNPQTSNFEPLNINPNAQLISQIEENKKKVAEIELLNKNAKLEKIYDANIIEKKTILSQANSVIGYCTVEDIDSDCEMEESLEMNVSFDDENDEKPSLWYMLESYKTSKNL